MHDTQLGVAKGLYGHFAANELLSFTIREGALVCKAKLAVMAATREGRSSPGQLGGQTEQAESLKALRQGRALAVCPVQGK
jgi:hypothetical protein